jgi:curli biogenesis system outer membrane secretion channel CsgG
MRNYKAIALAAMLLVPGQLSAQKAKPIVAIEQMEDLAGTGEAEKFSAMVATAIQSTGKFRVMERRMGTLMREQTRAKGGVVTTRTPGRVGGFEGVDFLIYGSLTSVSASNKADIGSTVLSGLFTPKGAQMKSCSNRIATLGVDIKITDADSGEIKYVTRIDEKQKSAASCSGQGEIDTAMLLRSAADKVASGLVMAIYPIQVAAVQPDGGIILNYGEGSIQPGSIMSVYSKGAAIRDPASGDIIGNTETKLGLIRVAEVTGRLSKAMPVTSFVTLPPVGSIVRAASADEVKALTKQKKNVR